MIKAMTCNADGMLADNTDLCACAWVDAFRDRGFAVGLTRTRRQVGRDDGRLPPVLPDQDEAGRHAGGIEKGRGDGLQERCLPRIRMLPYAGALFEHLPDDERRVTLVFPAGGGERGMHRKAADIGDSIHAREAFDAAGSSKPCPGILQAAPGRLRDVAPGDAVVVGDAPRDGQAAVGWGCA